MTKETPTYSAEQIRLRLNAARVVASEKQPYLSTAIFAMAAVKVEGLGTFASDNKWRLYFDPAKLMEWPIDQLSGVILHEVGHCIRGHADRFTAIGDRQAYAKIFNIAGDSLINADLRDDHIPLPEGAVYDDTLIEQGYDVSREMSAEQIYQIIKQKVEEQCTCGSQQSDSGDNETSSESSDSGSGEREQNDSEQNSEPNSKSSNSQNEDHSSSNNNGGGEGQSDPNCPLHGNHWDCGSGADGIAREYEKLGDAVDPGVDGDRGDLIRQQVAVEITRHAKDRGNVPAGYARWAKEYLDPTVDWRKELASLVRRSFAQVAGLRDYTYRRPSRRDSSMKASGQNIILPAMRQPNPPRVSIVIDTSGSMSDDELGWALAETQGVLRSLGSSGRQVQVISCDAKASVEKVTNVSRITLQGGGGTDMTVGIDAAMQSKPKPDVIIVLTDGYTPWPVEPLKGTTLIIGLTEEGAAASVPDWARQVLINPDIA